MFFASFCICPGLPTSGDLGFSIGRDGKVFMEEKVRVATNFKKLRQTEKFAVHRMRVNKKNERNVFSYHVVFSAPKSICVVLHSFACNCFVDHATNALQFTVTFCRHSKRAMEMNDS